MTKVKQHFICTGCGEDRPCFIETNRDYFITESDEIVCILDKTNQTSYNWKEYKKDKT